MAISVIPIIYDHASKKVLRWYVLDNESQRSDPAFNPRNAGERMLNVPFQIYSTFGRTDRGHPALDDVQNYVNANAP